MCVKVSAKGCDPEIRGFSVQNAPDEMLLADGKENPLMLHAIAMLPLVLRCGALVLGEPFM